MASILNATTSSGLVTSADNSGSLQLATNNGTTAVTIDTSQNVGIGTSSPSSYYKPNVVINNSNSTGLSIIDTSTTLGMIAFGFGSNGTLGGNSNRGKFWYDLANDSFNWNIAGAGSLTPQMRINSSGNVGIGTSTPSQKLAVIGDAYVDTYLGIGVAPASTAVITADAALNARDGIRLSTNNSPASGSFISFRNLSGNVAGSITHTGTTTVAYNTSSDYRLKENIAPMTNALTKVQALKPCTYTWKEDGTDGEGFIAHELAEVCPQAVTFEKDAVDADGNPKYQGVDTSFLVATLTAAIQELKAELDATKAEVQALKGVA
jgi:hypothetical protein